MGIDSFFPAGTDENLKKKKKNLGQTINIFSVFSFKKMGNSSSIVY